MTSGVEDASHARGRDGEVWTVLRLMRWSGTWLEEKGVERGRLDAEHILAHVLGVKRLQLYLQYDRPLGREDLDRFRPLLRRRAEREPLQYILGHAAFRELELMVDPRVLVPRPETEVLVEEVLTWAAARGKALSAVDVGTGSGAIALSLVHEGPFPTVVAIDASSRALEVARENARATGLAERVDFREGSLFAPLGAGETFDVVVSNPPYVAEAEASLLEPEVGTWEPSEALFGGPDGLAVIRPLVAGAGGHLNAGGLLALEVGAGQAGPVVAEVEATGAYDDVRVRRDLAGRERLVLATRSGRRSVHQT